MVSEIEAAIHALRPNATWALRGTIYSALDWKDTNQTKPSEAEVTAMMATLAAEAAADAQRRSGIAADPRTVATVNRLRTASAADIDNYLTANVTTLAQARVALGDIVKVLALYLQTR